LAGRAAPSKYEVAGDKGERVVEAQSEIGDPVAISIHLNQVSKAARVARNWPARQEKPTPPRKAKAWFPPVSRLASMPDRSTRSPLSGRATATDAPLQECPRTTAGVASDPIEDFMDQAG
jgi:hypothetical protein